MSFLPRSRSRYCIQQLGGFNGDFERLHRFDREFVHYLHCQRLESTALKGTILWEGHDKFLAQTEMESDAKGFHETGLARFAASDHQFLLTDDSRRHCSYCLLLLSHVDIDEDDLRERASNYGLEEEIDTLLRYPDTRGVVDDDHCPE